LFIAGITALFLAFSSAYIYTRVQNGTPAVQIPLIFIFNTLLLFLSSITLMKAKKYYRRDQTASYKHALLLAIVLSIVFLVGQIYGWSSLFRQQIPVSHSQAASYLYLISGIHFVHVLVGIPFLVLFYTSALKRMVDPVTVLLYFADPEKKLKLKLLTLYWHFLDVLWIYLVIFFVVNSLL
ncbi:MAG: cytochrome c oxidase subunit 3, partial [Saprospiraceae bacterium]|nr:cytochrome c oxidase subunit 3 [Saprospiraceae bacterium]